MLGVQYGTRNTDAASYMAAYNPLRYRSYYRDDEGFLTYYLQSRYYENQFNRFLNADIPDIALQSKAEINGLNLFAYCNNDPVNYTDPTGYAKKTIWNKLKEAIVSVIKKIKGYIFNYFKNEFKFVNNGILIGVSLLGSIFNTIASVVMTVAFVKSFNVLAKGVTKAALKKAPAKVQEVVHFVINKLKDYGIFDALANTLLFFVRYKASKILIKRKYSISNSIKAIAKDMFLNSISAENSVLRKIDYVVSAFSSVGGFLAFILDLCDLHPDGKVFFSTKFFTCNIR